MFNPVVRTFIHLQHAQDARTELLASGFDADEVQIDVRVDETGPVQGNFAVGDNPDVKGKTAYTHTYAPVAQDDVRDCQMMVNVSDPVMVDRAAAILERHGGIDPEQRARRAEHLDPSAESNLGAGTGAGLRH